MSKQVMIHELNKIITLNRKDGVLLTNEIYLDETQQYTFEILENRLATGIKIHRTPAEEPIMSKEKIKELFNIESFNIFYICHTDHNKIIVSFFENEVNRSVKVTEKKIICQCDNKCPTGKHCVICNPCKCCCIEMDICQLCKHCRYCGNGCECCSECGYAKCICPPEDGLPHIVVFNTLIGDMHPVAFKYMTDDFHICGFKYIEGEMYNVTFRIEET